MPVAPVPVVSAPLASVLLTSVPVAHLVYPKRTDKMQILKRILEFSEPNDVLVLQRVSKTFGECITTSDSLLHKMASHLLDLDGRLWYLDGQSHLRTRTSTSPSPSAQSRAKTGNYTPRLCS